MNGIFGNEEGFRRNVREHEIAGYYNPSHGFFADITQTALSMLLLGFGDSLGNGFSQFLHTLASSSYADVRVHSQATAHTVMQAFHGNQPSGMNVALNSPAINQGLAMLGDSVYSGSFHYNQPLSDIANVYTFPLNPLRLLIIMNPPAGAAVHTSNTFPHLNESLYLFCIHPFLVTGIPQWLLVKSGMVI